MAFFVLKLAFPFLSLLILVYGISIFSDAQSKNIVIILAPSFLLNSLSISNKSCQLQL